MFSAPFSTPSADADYALPDPIVHVARPAPRLLPAGAVAWAPGSPPGRWAPTALPVPFVLDASANADAAALPRAVLAAELDVALRTWSLPACSGFRGRFAGDAADGQRDGDDGVNVVIVHAAAWPGGLTPGAVAQTVVHVSADGRLHDADVHLNAVDWRFSRDGAAGTIDLRSVLVHELGHALGLGHTSDPRATMATNGSGVRWRSLEADDVLGVCTLYPGAGDGGCEQAEQAPCPAGYACVARRCQRLGERADLCAPCDPGAATPPCEAAGDGARCVDPSLLPAGDAPPGGRDPAGSVCGRPCEDERDCGPGFGCRRTTAAGDLQCVARDACRSAASPCASSGDCAGATCAEGACVGLSSRSPGGAEAEDAGAGAPATQAPIAIAAAGGGCAQGDTGRPVGSYAALAALAMIGAARSRRTRAR
jgi:hypothetical protein